MSEDLQAEIQATLDGLVVSGAEIGLQVAVVHEGRLVVDAVAGVADQRTAEAVNTSTLFFATSTGKGIASTVAHVLVERGELAYDQRVADVWPEFAAHGKDSVTLADVLVHTGGVPGLWPQITPEDLCDGERVCGFVADQSPWWRPGTMTGYHVLTFGFVLGSWCVGRLDARSRQYCARRSRRRSESLTSCTSASPSRSWHE